MERQEIIQLIQSEIARVQTKELFSPAKTPFHTHNNLDAPRVSFSNLVNAPQTFVIAADTNGTTNVNVFGAGGVPYNLTITGVYLISKDTTAGNITVLRGTSTVATIAKGTTTGALVGATSLANTSYTIGQACQVDSSTAGNATVFITYVV